MAAPRSKPASRRSLSRALWAAAVALAVAAAAWLLWAPSVPAAQPPAPSSGVAEPDAGSDPGTGTPARPVRAAWVPGAPRRVVIRALGVDAAVVPVQAPRGTLVPPGDAATLGWWADGARPGEARGSALVTGHTVQDGPGALNRLEDLRPGDRVVVRTDRDSIRYAVRSVRVFSRGAIADRAEQLFSQGVPGRLVLVTCEDWDGERYLSNVVVTAVPTAT